MVCGKLCTSLKKLRLKDPFHNTLMVTFITCLSAAYTSVYPFTYLPEMIRWFGYSESEKGYYGGFVASSFFIGNASFSYFWGWLSDKKGRKPVLILQLFLTGIFCLSFGFCQTFTSAIIIRFFDGASNGVLTVGNAILFDSTDDSNQAFALSMAATAWGLGVCMGPLVSGYLASPASKYPRAFDPTGFYKDYPYAIPSFIGFAFVCINALIVFVFLPGKDRKVGEYEPFVSDDVEADKGHSSTQEDRVSSASGSSDSLCTNYRPLKSDDDDDKISSSPARKKPEKDCLCTDQSNKTYGLYEYVIKTAKNNPVYRLMRYRSIAFALIVYSLFTFATIGFWEILPVWLSTSPNYGGLGFSSDNIGLVLGTVTIVGLVFQAVIVIRFERRFGSIASFVLFSCMLSITMQVVPLCRLIKISWLLWAAVFASALSIATSMPACYAAISIIVNNSAPVNQVGAVNGLAQTLGSFIKSLGPITGGNLFTYSITSNLGPPIDSSTVFVFFGMVIWLSSIAVYFFPRHLDRQVKVGSSSAAAGKDGTPNGSPSLKGANNLGYDSSDLPDKSLALIHDKLTAACVDDELIEIEINETDSIVPEEKRAAGHRRIYSFSDTVNYHRSTSRASSTTPVPH